MFLDLIDFFFHLSVLLKPDFNCWNNFALSWVDRVITDTKSFVSVILNLPSPAELVIAQVDYHVNKKANFPINQRHFKSSPKIA